MRGLILTPFLFAMVMLFSALLPSHACAFQNDGQDTMVQVKLKDGTLYQGELLLKKPDRLVIEQKKGTLISFPDSMLSSVDVVQILSMPTDPFLLYVTPGGLLKDDGSGIGLDLVFPNNWGVGFNYRYVDYVSSRKPADYDPGGHYETNCAWILFCWDDYVYESIPDPYDCSDQYSISVLKKYGAQNSLARFGWQAGISYLDFVYYDFIKKSLPGFYGSNYKVIEKEKKTIGVQFGINIELPLTRYWGIGFLALEQLSQEKNMLILEVNFPMGLIRGRRHIPRRLKAF